VLYAIEYAEMLGLAPMAALTGVHVIEGKPTASAGLISGLVRQAGHRLRVRGDNKSATCEITRSDDPEHPFSVTWTLKKEPGDNPSAEVAGLLNKGTWKNYPSAMLKSRAITQCARDACEEVLFGLHYTPEELGAEVDEDGVVVGEVEGEPAQQQEPADNPWYVRPSPEQEWLAKALEAAPAQPTLDGCKADWQKSVKYVNDGTLTREEAGQLQAALRVRIEALRTAGQAASEEVVEGEIVGLDADDPWAAKVEEIPEGDEAAIAAVLEEAAGMLGRNEIDAEHYARIEAAVEAKFPKDGGQVQVAA
jgi:hypothetical protein